MGRLLKAFSVFIIVGVVLLPVSSHAEAEQIYIDWIDIDYMESNPLMSWVEDIKDQLADASPFLGQLLIPEDDTVSNAEDDELDYNYEEDDLSLNS